MLVVSHKATIRILLCNLMGIDVGRYRDHVGVSVSSIAVVEFHAHGPLLTRLGDRSHLRERCATVPGHKDEGSGAIFARQAMAQ